jgi:hypothetical protein
MGLLLEICCIFEGRLYAVKWGNEKQNELHRLLTLWNNVQEVYSFVKANKSDIPRGVNAEMLSQQIIDNANDIDDRLLYLSTQPGRSLGEFFRSLDNNEYRVLSLSKQKARKNYLRLYAIRLNADCFLVTGGAIKFHHLNKDRPHTQIEMQKLSKCKDYLIENGVFDADDLYQYLKEQS